VELTRADGPGGACGLLGTGAESPYLGFRKEKSNSELDGTWPHPHGSLHISKKGKREHKFHLLYHLGASLDPPDRASNSQRQ